MSSQYWSWSLDREPASRTESERLAKLLHPFNARVRMMAVLDLQALFDEAGTDAESQIAVVAGLLGPASAWIELEQLWLTALTDAGAVLYHATDAEASPRPRKKFKGWSKKRARALTDQMAGILKASEEIVHVGVYCEAKDWQAVAARLITPHFDRKDATDFRKNPWKLVYNVLVKDCLNLVVKNLSPTLPKAEKVAFIFEDNDWKHDALTGYDDFKKLYQPSQSCRFGTIAFEPKLAFPGLQAADLFAWSYRRVMGVRLGHVKADVDRSFLTLMSTADRPQFCQLTEEALEDEMKKAIAWMIATGQIS